LARPAPVLDGVVFAKTPQRELTLDLYLPEGVENPPLLIYIHGGGWRAGNLKEVPLLHLMNEGLAVASVSYRFSQEARFPAQLDDVKAAIRWLRENAENHGYDGSRIALSGASAGAYLAMLAGCTADDETGPVRAVVSYYGPTDFLLRARTQPHRANPRDSVTHQLLGSAPLDDIPLAMRASPAHQVRRDAPPFLLFHGTADTTVLPDQAERMAAAIETAGRPVILRIKEGAGHHVADFTDEENQAVLRAFLREHLELEKQ